MNDDRTHQLSQIKTVLRGYDKSSVDRLFTELHTSLEDAIRREEETRIQLVDLTDRARKAESEHHRLKEKVVQLEGRLVQADQVARERGRAMLSEAQGKAVTIIDQAREEADAVLRQAEDRAGKALTAAENEYKKLRAQVGALYEKRSILVARMQAILDEYRTFLEAIASELPPTQDSIPSPFLGMTPNREVTARDLHTILSQLQQKDEAL